MFLLWNSLLKIDLVSWSLQPKTLPLFYSSGVLPLRGLFFANHGFSPRRYLLSLTIEACGIQMDIFVAWQGLVWPGQACQAAAVVVEDSGRESEGFPILFPSSLLLFFWFICLRSSHLYRGLHSATACLFFPPTRVPQTSAHISKLKTQY